MDQVRLHDLQIDAILGILGREQQAPQRLIVDVSMELPLHIAGEHDRLDASIDYAAVADQITFLCVHGRFRLLETLGLAIARLLLLPPVPGESRAPLDAVSITLRKPDVLGGRAVPSVSMRREARALDFPRVGPADVLCATTWNSAHRVCGDVPTPSDVAVLSIAPSTRLVVAHPPWTPS